MNSAPLCKFCEHRHWLSESHVFVRDVTKPVTILPLVTKPAKLKKVGRPLVGAKPMTPVDRQRRHRAKL